MQEEEHRPQGAVGDILRAYRAAAGLTQEHLAERAGISARSLRDLERGRSAPRADTLCRLADALDLSPARRAPLFAPPQQRPARIGQMLPPVIGRDEVIARLERYLAGEGRPLLLLVGDPGIGKTRLLQEAAPRAMRAGYTVLAGGVVPHGGREPYESLRQMLRAAIRAQDAETLRARLEGCAWLVSLLPELADGPLAPLPTHSLPPDQRRAYLSAAVARFLRNVAGPAGTLLLLDDLHAVDADSLDLYATLPWATAEPPLRAIAAYRQTALGPGDRLDAALTTLAHAGLATRQTLAPLSEQAARALLGVLVADLEGTDADRVLERAAGIPFYLVSYAHGLRTGQRETAPWDVAQSVRQRVAALTSHTRELLRVAAIMGREVRRERLGAALAAPEEAVDEALDEACRAGLLRAEGAGRYRFGHDLIWEIIEADIGPGRRAALHRRVARALERVEAEALPVEALAYHYGQCDDARAAHYLELAGDRARQQGTTEPAESAYAAAIDRLDRAHRALDAARVRLKLGQALRYGGHGYERALETLERAVAVYTEAGDWAQLGRAAAEIAYTHAARGTAREGIARLAQVHLLLETEVALGAPGQGLAALEAALAQLSIAAGMPAEHLAALERAAALARQAHDPTILATAELNRGAALLILGRVPEAVAVMEEGARLAEAAGNLPALLTALSTAATLLIPMTEFDLALAHLRQARAVAERLGDLASLPLIHYLQGEALRYTGRWEPARLAYERGLALARQIDGSWGAWAPAMGLALLALTRGELEEARRHLDESLRQARRSGYPFAVPWVQNVLTRRALQAGCLADARAALRPLRDLPATPILSSSALVLRAWADLEGGDLAAAAELAERARASAEAERATIVVLEVHWVRARLETRRRRWDRARQALDEGLALARRAARPGRVAAARGIRHL